MSQEDKEGFLQSVKWTLQEDSDVCDEDILTPAVGNIHLINISVQLQSLWIPWNSFHDPWECLELCYFNFCVHTDTPPHIFPGPLHHLSLLLIFFSAVSSDSLHLFSPLFFFSNSVHIYVLLLCQPLQPEIIIKKSSVPVSFSGWLGSSEQVLFLYRPFFN